MRRSSAPILLVIVVAMMMMAAITPVNRVQQGTSITSSTDDTGTATVNVNLPGASCTAGNDVTAIGADGTGTCSANVSSIVNGTSITHSTTSGAATINVALPGASCAAGTQVSAIGADGTGTCSADVTSVVAGTSITSSTTSGAATINVNLPGGTCSNGQRVTAVSASGVATCTDVNAGLQSPTYWTQGDELCNVGVNNNMESYGSANAAVHVATTVVTGNPCIDDMQTGVNTNGRVNISAQNQAIILGASTAGKWKWYGRVQVPTLSTSGDEFADVIGMTSVMTTTINANAMLALNYDRGNVATAPTTGAGNTGNKNNWICRSGDAGVYTEYVMDGTVVSDAGFTTANQPIVAGTWYDLEFDYDSTLGTPEVDFYVNGTLSCKITTHIPANTAGATHNVGVVYFQHLKSAGTNSRSLYVDYWNVYNYGLSR